MEFDIKKLTPDVRKLNDMRKVLCDTNFVPITPSSRILDGETVGTKSSPDMDLYFMYRKVKQENGLVHNITIILAKMLGFEFAKTKGHIHIGDFKEIYTVIEGRAIFLMQKGNADKIEDVYAVEAKEGESAVIPEGYGHVTINPSETENLKTGDWTADGCKSDYSLFEEKRGACYYYTKTGWIKNDNYKDVPPLRFEQPLKSVPENLDFLKSK